ncbi:UDP-N-acetylglucosamine 1-carboxyvinyltransferase [bacterium]|jgi:UDP-N-acetylglucosamine 1-carboxyvinyltransferase|nr:UDP-N-acetylglucosamine 1-carboxyvinyltransferase [bacterium]MBT4121507.1 UDP-N-acetylglucosamine 1-carboxyvinyltransferase [bacterium]MBT4495904.1 UDP-N-acetylglucosamine 1-carboxyvinyltransferase [bacterium]MBT4764072.1 UDP-N-acetylglucosamine 1-carboxyvinyltransferase [bacterium]MBT5401444.1 UDP-N-acetylglucosamine 1-carboxyvinyltransferase [bacterium]
MSKFIIQGGQPLKGTITTNTSKNAAIALICASLLNKGTTTLFGVPRIQEVERIIEVLESIGVNFEWFKKHDLKITPPKRIDMKKVNKKAAIRTRIIILLAGVLSHDLKEFFLPKAGGCRLGKRTVNPHFFALEEFGIKVTEKSNGNLVTRNVIKAAPDLVLYESGDTVTENALLAASRIKDKSVIKFASANYQVQDLCYFLETLGVKIKGIGTTTLEIKGKKKIKKNVKHYLSEDPIESMFYISLAATTKSSFVIKRCPIDFLDLELLKLKKMGFKYKVLKKYKARNKKTNLVDIKTFPSDLVALPDKIYGRPYPGLNIDNLPFFVPIATQAKGRTFIHDWAYENRSIYFTEFNKLGASIQLNDQHRLFVEGPTKLTGTEIMCPSALRPGAILIVGMLAAQGESVLRDVYQVERGYEDLHKRLLTLGAKIVKKD